jgi:hypothetical protein
MRRRTGRFNSYWWQLPRNSTDSVGSCEHIPSNASKLLPFIQNYLNSLIIGSWVVRIYMVMRLRMTNHWSLSSGTRLMTPNFFLSRSSFSSVPCTFIQLLVPWQLTDFILHAHIDPQRQCRLLSIHLFYVRYGLLLPSWPSTDIILHALQTIAPDADSSSTSYSSHFLGSTWCNPCPDTYSNTDHQLVSCVPCMSDH